MPTTFTLDTLAQALLDQKLRLTQLKQPAVQQNTSQRKTLSSCFYRVKKLCTNSVDNLVSTFIQCILKQPIHRGELRLVNFCATYYFLKNQIDRLIRRSKNAQHLRLFFIKHFFHLLVSKVLHLTKNQHSTSLVFTDRIYAY